MKRALILFLAGVIFMFSQPAFTWWGKEAKTEGETMKHSGAWSESSNYEKMCRTDKIETISGDVVSIDEFSPQESEGVVRSMFKSDKGIQLMLKTENETLAIHLGPKWFIENQNFSIEKGDSIKVKGSRITYDGKPALIAFLVKKADHVLSLRDNKCSPTWNGWKPASFWSDLISKTE
jgi:hypothetical protein